jgi:type IV pilus assembly protein PilC
MRMPAITQNTLEAARVAGPLVLLFGSILLLTITGRFFWDTIKPFGLELKSLGIVDRILWSLPLAHGYALNRGMADACALLGDATAGGIPIDRAILEASRLPVNAVLRARLMEWADRVSEGRPLADAGRDAGIPRILIDMLATACSTRNAADLFRFFEDYYRARFSRSRYVLEAMVIPLTALVMGLVVACVALSLFVPLVAMIEHLCESPMKL